MNEFYLQSKPISPSETQLEKHKGVLALGITAGIGSGFTGYSYKGDVNTAGGTAAGYYRFNNSTAANTFIIVPIQFYSITGVSGCSVQLLK